MQPVINITMKSYSKIGIGEARPGAMWPEKQETGEPLGTVTAMWFLPKLAGCEYWKLFAARLLQDFC